MALTEDDARNLARALNELEATTGKQDATQRLFNARMDQATKTVGSLADAFVTYNKEIYKGSSGAKAFTSSMDKMSEAAVAAAAGLALLVPGGPVMKAVIAGLGLLAGKLLQAGKAITEQTDEVYKAYQQMAQIGATGAGAMQDVFDGLMKVGMGTEKFGDYIKMINESATDLAAFSGTVNKGRRTFEDTMASLSDTQRVQMEQMGLDRKAQSEAVMTYIKQQRLLTAGTKSQMDLSSTAVMRYIKETDELARITGANREEQQKLLDKAMSEEIFAAFIDELESQGEEGKERAKIAKQANIMAEKLYGPEVARGLRDATTGFVGSSKASEKFFMTFGQEGQEFTDRLRDTTQTSADLQRGFSKLAKGGADTYEQFRGLAAMGASQDVLMPIGELRKSAGVMGQNLEKAGEEARLELTKQLADPMTKKMAEQENNVRATQIMLQTELNKGMSLAIDAMAKTAEENRKIVEKFGKLPITPMQEAFEGLLDVVKKLVDTLSPFVEKLAGGLFGGISALLSGDGKKFGQVGGGEAFGQVGGAYAGMKGGAAVGAGIGAAFGGVGAAPGAFIGGALGAIGGYFGGGALGRLGDRDAAGPSGRLSGKTSGVKPELLQALANAAADFGQPIPINSGLRTREEQAQLYADYQSGRSRFPAAPPGSSNHESGAAVDIPLEIANSLDSMGLLAKHGLARPVPGDPIHITLAKVPRYEAGGNLRGIGLVGEKGPELAVGSGSITSNNDIMGAFRDMISLLEQNQMALKDIANNSKATLDTSDQMLRIAQN